MAQISQKLLERLIDSMGQRIAREFIKAITDMSDRSQINKLEIAIGAIEGEITNKALENVLDAAGIRFGSLNGLTEEIRAGYYEAGTFYIGEEVPVRFGAVFDLGNARAEDWLQEQSSQLITQLTDTQRDVVRDHLLDGFINGRNPHAIALDMVGRVGPAAGGPQSGSRQGGIFGLNRPQLQLTQDMRTALSGSDVGVLRLDKDGNPVKKFWIGDDGKLKSVYTRRDHRFDGTILKAIQDGVPLSKPKIDRLVSRYSDRLLELRGTTIGRVEALSSMNEAQHESLRQVVDNGYAEEDAVIRIWHHSQLDDARPGHKQMEGQKRGLNKPFDNPVTGAKLMHPLDSAASASETINCRCKVEHKIDFIALEGGAPLPKKLTKAELLLQKESEIDITKSVNDVATELREIYPDMNWPDALQRAGTMKGKPIPGFEPIDLTKPFSGSALTNAEAFYAADSAITQTGFEDVSRIYVRGRGEGEEWTKRLRDKSSFADSDFGDKKRARLDKILENWDGDLTSLSTEDMTVYRGWSSENIEEFKAKYKVGSVITDDGFWSTSANKVKATVFADEFGQDKGILFEIQTPAGTRFWNPLKNLDPNADSKTYRFALDEFELVLRPGTSIEILEIHDRDGGLRVVARLVGDEAFKFEEALNFYELDVASAGNIPVEFREAVDGFLMGEDSFAWNDFLRGKTDDLTDEQSVGLSTILTNWEDMASVSTADISVYRGFSLDSSDLKKFKAEWNIGSVVADEGFWATSINQGTAKVFSTGFGPVTSVVVEIQIPKGTSILNPQKIWLSGNNAVNKLMQWEEELILPPGTSIKILRYNETDNEIRIVARLFSD